MSADQADLTASVVGFPWSLQFNTGCQCFENDEVSTHMPKVGEIPGPPLCRNPPP